MSDFLTACQPQPKNMSQLKEPHSKISWNKPVPNRGGAIQKSHEFVLYELLLSEL